MAYERGVEGKREWVERGDASEIGGGRNATLNYSV